MQLESRKTLWELRRIHQEYAAAYKRRIPSSFLTLGMDAYIYAIADARQHARSQEDWNYITVCELFFKDFIDPDGTYEMTKTLDKAMELSKTDPDFNRKNYSL